MIFLASSWKNRERVHALALALRANGHEVFDFTDTARRKTEEFPREKVLKPFDPDTQSYWEFLKGNPGYAAAVNESREMLRVCDECALILPCGNDSHADWALAYGLGKRITVVGHPVKGDWTLDHLWAEEWFPDDAAYVKARGVRAG